MNRKSTSYILKKDNRAAYYAINNDPRYILFTKVSIDSLRKFNSKLKIYLFIYGDLAGIDLSFFRKNNVHIINKSGVKKEYLTSLKWFSLQDLASLNVNSLIYFDADTIFFKKPDILFEDYNKFDYYAREELGTQKDKGGYLIGKTFIRPQINHNIYRQMTKKLGALNLPIFNTGVMLFNNKSFKKVAKLVYFYKQVMDNFRKDILPYPCLNSHIIDEIVGSITLGKIPEFTYGVLDKEISPWYIELREKAVKTTGIVMHVLNYLYWDYLSDPLSSQAGFKT